MPKKVYCNVEGTKILDNSIEIEDVQTVTLPDIQFTKTSVDSSGMVGAVDIPNVAHVDAMEYSIAHNNGEGCKQLANPGKHTTEVRVARQRYNTTKGEVELESVKFRMTGLHASTSKGTIENKNPYGSTDKYSLLRYEEEINGEVVTVIDLMSGVLKYNGKDYASEVESLLN